MAALAILGKDYMKEMTNRERILGAMKHESIDRTPMDFWGVKEIEKGLMKHFNVKNWVDLSKKMDIDKIINVGPILKKGYTYWQTWGIEIKEIAINNVEGFYSEPKKAPLADFETIDEIEAGYNFPSVELWDYSTIGEQCKAAE
jgi:hypothetical protein